MGIANSREMNLRVFSSLMAYKTEKKSSRFITKNIGQPLSFTRSFDNFLSSANSQLIERVVRKMQEAMNRPLTGVAAQFMTSTGQASFTVSTAPAAAALEIPAPKQWEIDAAVENAGGAQALSPWLVEGKTKLDIGGRRVVAEVAKDQAGEYEGLSERKQAEKAIARFGLDASRLDGDLEQLRTDLKAAARSASAENPNVAGAVEYALEDAFSRLSQYEAGNSEKAPARGTTFEEQRDKNLAQADSIARQLNLGEGQAWGVRSLAEDLAVFGMDLGALSRNPDELSAELKTKAQDMLAELGKRYVGTEAEFVTERNRITGASARLMNGLKGSGGSAMMTSSLSVSAGVTVSVGGQKVNASSIVAMSTVMVDPLVLDLNGDGINLKSAEEGVDFDMNGDGEKTRMGFIRGDDALLFVDTYGDGIVHDGRQLFGDGDGYANGFEKLAAYDDNGDGVIDELDAIFDQLRVWVEKIEDGICEASETMSLREAGIKSISLGYQNTREDDGKGNIAGQTGSFTRADGSQGKAADMWFNELR